MGFMHVLTVSQTPCWGLYLMAACGVGTSTLVCTSGKRLASKATELVSNRAGVWNPGLSEKLVPFLEVTEAPYTSGPPLPSTKVHILGKGDSMYLGMGGAY